MTKPSATDTLEARLKKAGIEPEDLAEVIWQRLRPKIIGMLKHMADSRAAERQALLVEVVGGLAVKWKECGAGEESATQVAEMAERLVAAVIRTEERRINGNGY